MKLIATGISKHYAGKTVVSEISLTLEAGIVGLLGANGSGKSSLLRLFATLTRPDSGQLYFNGLNYASDLDRLRGQIGYLPQDLELPGHLTPLKLLNYLALIKGITRKDTVNALADSLKLHAMANLALSKLSAGQLRMVGIAQALLGSPPLVLLDEPTKGLDLHEKQRVFGLLRRVQHNSLIILSSHIPEEIEYVADQIVILQAGRTRYSGRLDALYDHFRDQVYEIHISVEAVNAIMPAYRVSSMNHTENGVILRLVGNKPSDYPFKVIPPSLTDLYMLMKS